MVGERRVRLLLDRIRRNLTDLHDDAALGKAALRSDPIRLRALKYSFAVTIEGCIDLAQHLCASEGWGPIESNASAMQAIARHGVLEADLGSIMARAVGFRNVIVHDYADIDDDRVVGYIDRLDDLDAFVRAVGSWVEAQAAESPEQT